MRPLLRTSPALFAVLTAMLAQAQTAPATTLTLNAQLVQVNCTAFDHKTHVPLAIDSADQVRVYEDGKPQPVVALRRSDDLPLTLAVLLDVSGSEGGQFGRMKRTAADFLNRTLRPGDHFFVLAFNNQLRMLQDLTEADSSLAEVTAPLEKMDTRQGVEFEHRDHAGNTRLWDAMFFAVRHMEPSTGRKALVVLTDGGENASIAGRDELVQAAQTQGIPFYALIVFPPTAVNPLVAAQILADRRLAHIVEDSGGQLFHAANDSSMVDRLSQVTAALRAQFIVEYRPPDGSKPGYHDVDVVAVRPHTDLHYKQGTWR